MRIALIVTQGEHGGVQDLLARFMHWLKKNGHEVAVFCGTDGWLQKRCEEAQIPFIRLKHLKREIHPVHDLLAIKEIKDALTQFRPDAVHLNSTKTGIIGSIAAHLAKVKRVTYRIGGWVFLEDLPAWKKQIYILAEKYTARVKDIIICVHPADIEVANTYKIKPKQKIISVPNGINAEQFRLTQLPRGQARVALGIDGFVFGTIANFYPPKDLPRYIEACSLVAQKMPQARFLLIGDGEQRSQIEAAIKTYGLEKQVMLAGTREDADISYNAFDIFVLPSSKEGMSWALLKAMAAGIPSIATDVGAAKWMLSDNCGVVVPPQNPRALADAMIDLASNEAMCNQLSENAKNKAASSFQEEATYRGNLEALEA
ncbi:glycosyltransferase family 4 protein [Candidatus Uhrbacteria bacterium]|nr:glycosyltransferase family 4 protein [Candidatus Uhrbacteria bacterium]